MVNSFVERATSDMLMGPDWATNLQICDMIIRDPGQAKDIVRGIKKRLGSKQAKVQLLALTLLETTIKNCGNGDIIHAHVAEKDIPRELVKIVKKKPDFHVKEKILTLIDTWQEALGGPRARYPQYYAAYQELLRAGAVFPQKSQMSAPVLTSPQRQSAPVLTSPQRESAPVLTYPQRQSLGLSNQNQHNPDHQPDAPGSSAQSNVSTVSLTEIQNAQGIVDVLAEILNALDPENKEGLRQDVVIDLVEQCCCYKQRVAHLVNSTWDESLLCQGLLLNDDLQRVLSMHEAIASRISVQKEKLKLESVGAYHDAHGPPVNTSDNSILHEIISTNTGSGTQTIEESLLPAPAATNGRAQPAKYDPKLDLLSGDEYIAPLQGTSLALVPLAEQPPTTPVSQQNALVPFDIFYECNQTDVANTQSASSSEGAHASVSHQQHQNFQSPLHLNGSAPTPRLSHCEQSLNTHGSDPGPSSQLEQQQSQPVSPCHGVQSSESFPPPPWESNTTDDNGSVTGDQYHHSMKMTQVIFTHVQGGVYPQAPQPIENDHVVGVYIQPIMSSQISGLNGQLDLPPQTFHGSPYGGMLSGSLHTGQMTALYPSQMYGYVQQQGHTAQYMEQRMYGLSIRDDNNGIRSSYQISASSDVLPSRPSRPEDGPFGDLVDMAKFKSTKTTAAGAGNE